MKKLMYSFMVPEIHLRQRIPITESFVQEWFLHFKKMIHLIHLKLKISSSLQIEIQDMSKYGMVGEIVKTLGESFPLVNLWHR